MHDTVAGRDGTDTVYDGENFRFADGDVPVGEILNPPDHASSGGDTSYHLDLAGSLSDDTGSESLSGFTIDMNGVPDGTTFSAGRIEDGKWVVSADEASGGITMTVPDGAPEFQLNVSVTATEANGDTNTTTVTIDVGTGEAQTVTGGGEDHAASLSIEPMAMSLDHGAAAAPDDVSSSTDTTAQVHGDATHEIGATGPDQPHSDTAQETGSAAHDQATAQDAATAGHDDTGAAHDQSPVQDGTGIAHDDGAGADHAGLSGSDPDPLQPYQDLAISQDTPDDYMAFADTTDHPVQPDHPGDGGDSDQSDYTNFAAAPSTPDAQPDLPPADQLLGGADGDAGADHPLEPHPDDHQTDLGAANIDPDDSSDFHHDHDGS